MKISQGMKSFAHERALIVACGDTKAKLHFAHQGFIDYLGSVIVPVSKFSDREGFFMSSGRGMVFRTGAVYENQKEHRHKQFVSELIEQLDRHVTDLQVTSIYLFCPDHGRNSLVDVLEKKFNKQMRFVLPEYHVDEHPFLLIKKIEQAKQEAFQVLHEPSGEQQKKLLKRKWPLPRWTKLRNRIMH